MLVDPDGNWVMDVFWLMLDAAEFMGHPSLAGAGWIAADLAAFADPSGIASTVAHAGKMARVGKRLSKAVKLSKRAKRAKRASHSKQTGSYTIEFESGKKYHGKGPKNRAKQSAKEKEKKYNDKAKKIDWTPSANDREAFKDEYKRLKNDGGYRNPNNYNKIESPGKRYYYEDN